MNFSWVSRLVLILKIFLFFLIKNLNLKFLRRLQIRTFTENTKKFVPGKEIFYHKCHYNHPSFPSTFHSKEKCLIPKTFLFPTPQGSKIQLLIWFPSKLISKSEGFNLHSLQYYQKIDIGGVEQKVQASRL